MHSTPDESFVFQPRQKVTIMKVSRIKDHAANPDVRRKPRSLTSSLVSLLERVAAVVTQAVPQHRPEPVLFRVRR